MLNFIFLLLMLNCIEGLKVPKKCVPNQAKIPSETNVIIQQVNVIRSKVAMRKLPFFQSLPMDKAPSRMMRMVNRNNLTRNSLYKIFFQLWSHKLAESALKIANKCNAKPTRKKNLLFQFNDDCSLNI